MYASLRIGCERAVEYTLDGRIGFSLALRMQPGGGLASDVFGRKEKFVSFNDVRVDDRCRGLTCSPRSRRMLEPQA